VIQGAAERKGVLLERDRELERIRRCIQRALQGHGSALLVEGPGGFGKTVLLAAARDTAEAEGFRVLRARGAELEQEFAFGVVRQLVESVFAGASQEERADLLEGPPRVAARLLGLSGLLDGAGEPALIAPDPSFAVLHGLYWLCADVATRRPLALVVDDAHWVDGASLRFLAFLLPRLEELRVAVLLAGRPAEAGETRQLLAALERDPATEIVNLRPLTTEGVARLLASALGTEPDPGFAAASWEATGGTPFLVGMLVDTLREEGIAPTTASSAKVKGLANAALGRRAVLKLERLGSEATRLACAMAILEQAELAEAFRLAALTPQEGARAADLLVQAGILQERPPSLAHPLLRASIYREIPVADRAEAHGRAARLLAEGHASPGRIAEQLLAATPTGDSWAVEQLLSAAGAATASGAPESASAYLRRALAEPPAGEATAAVLLELGVAEYSAGEPGWEPHLEEAVAAGAGTNRLAATMALARALGLAQRLAESIDVCDRASAWLDDRDTEAGWVLESMAVSCGLLDSSLAPAMAARAGALRARANQPSAPRPVLALAAWIAADANEPADRVAELAHQALASMPRAVQEPGDPWFSTAVASLFFAERYDEAQAFLDSAVAVARDAADGQLLPVVLSHRGWLGFRRGDLTAAEADARAVPEASGPSAPRLFRNLATAILVGVLLERGEYDEADRKLAPLAEDLQSTSRTAAVLRAARGRLRFVQRRLGEAVRDFRAIGEIALGTGAISPSFMPWRSELALAELALGDVDSARDHSEEELELARAFGAPRALGIALRAAGLVTGGQRGEQLLREAIEVLDGPHTRLEQARARADLGALLRRSNRRVDARQMLRQAVDAAHRIGARALADRAETELRATGAKPRRVLLTGLEALTASERRIAELAAEGLTNREIAQSLFVTDRTVEGHLTHVFSKLDVNARTELPAALTTFTHALRA
jgi:ATP/maltotriose-dependent transcriptional regulator MalT